MTKKFRMASLLLSVAMACSMAGCSLTQTTTSDIYTEYTETGFLGRGSPVLRVIPVPTIRAGKITPPRKRTLTTMVQPPMTMMIFR